MLDSGEQPIRPRVEETKITPKMKRNTGVKKKYKEGTHIKRIHKEEKHGDQAPA